MDKKNKATFFRDEEGELYFWAGNTIKEYHLGGVKNINVDLNLRKLDRDQVND